jgi:hypothetical protein
VSAAEKAPELTGFVWQAAKNSAWTATKPTTDLMYKFQYNIEQRRNGKLPVPALFILLQNIQCIWVCKSSNKTINLPVMFS